MPGGRGGGGGLFRREIFVGGRGGGGFRHNWKSHSSSCLTRTLTCNPMLRSESESVANQIATESSISSQYLKEPANPTN